MPEVSLTSPHLQIHKMVQKSGDHHLGRIKFLVNSGKKLPTSTGQPDFFHQLCFMRLVEYFPDQALSKLPTVYDDFIVHHTCYINLPYMEHVMWESVYKPQPSWTQAITMSEDTSHHQIVEFSPGQSIGIPRYPKVATPRRKAGMTLL